MTSERINTGPSEQHHGRRRFILLLSLLLGLCGIAFVPGAASIPVTDRDEARFAQATRQMIESGDFVRICFQDEPRHKKPVGVHWAQAASVRALELVGLSERASIFAYRLPSILGGVLAVVAIFVVARRWFSGGNDGALTEDNVVVDDGDVQTPWLAAALLATCILLAVEARLATTDAMLLAMTVVAQGALGEIYVASRRRQSRRGGAEGSQASSRGAAAVAAMFWMAMGFAILLKGPITPLISAMTIVTLCIADRRIGWLRDLRPLIGVPIALVIAAPWYVAAQIATDGAFLRDAFGGDLAPKLIGGHESHGFPPGYYLLLLTITFWPGSILAAVGLRSAWRTRRADHVSRFLLAWLVPAWIAFEFLPTKLPHYVLPLYPAIAIITARSTALAKLSGAASEPSSPSAVERFGFIIWGVVTLALGASIALAPRWLGGDEETLLVAPVIVLTIIAAAAPAALAWVGRYALALKSGALLSVALLAYTFAVIAPALDSIWIARRVAEIIPDETPAANVIAIEYHEPSLVFEIGAEVQLLNVSSAVGIIAGDRSAQDGGDSLGGDGETVSRYLIIPGSRLDSLILEPRMAGIQSREIGVVEGVNYSKGDRIKLHILRFEQ